MLANSFLEDPRLVRLPILQGLDGRAMTDRLLGQVVVVQPDIALERGFQIVQGQAQRRARIQHQRLLAVVQRLGQPMRRVTAIRRRRAAPPFPDGVPRRTEARR